MSRRARFGIETVAVVNGWNIERDQRSRATVYWYAQALCSEGYQIARHDAASRRAAEEWAAQNEVPEAPIVTPELREQRTRNAAVLAKLGAGDRQGK